ncbi:MAG TPA: hypothetical protein VKT17_01395 [Acidobacteriota bacterium]|nr:hypothetical protein [Acidobacteriota bacterium]
MTSRIRALGILAAGASLCGLALTAPSRPSPRPQDQVPALPLEKTIAVAGDAGWVDTAIDVGPGDELRISASGEINLQRGNPEAVCGPEGLDLVTGNQPIPNVNLGSLIGKVAQPVSRRVDVDSGIEIKDEIFILFPVGPEATVTVPLKGRLYLGVNENVLKDNGGMYSAVVVRRPA